jgi:cell division protein DivIC
LFDKLPSPLKNIYIVAILVFSVWMIFFDKHSLITHIKLTQIINGIHRDMDNYRKEIQMIETEKALMDSGTERYVREKYFMSRENEDVFIIIRK